MAYLGNTPNPLAGLYAPLTGATFTGAVAVPAGATGSQVPRASEVLPISGGSLTGGLTVGGALTSTGAATLNGTTIPASKTLVDSTTSQTLTNKTLTSPVLSTPVITKNVQVISTNTTAVSSNTYALTASLTLTLPLTPAAGDWIEVINASGVTTCVVGRNGSNIMSLAQDLTIDASDATAAFVLTYTNSTVGWAISN